ncbi:hypothetical protein GN244_ATG00672 [Phytophthora infestans]|uniref:FYVE-type domain-containing protein n=1 Tax=Phytophthora infestans TaxID=4787 RepID=A0A833SW53_PHYIN|nr:hypothetical protein GN244_ATG00672 [Phytophthora infestans]KAF4136234.1 hypothetical protein GN958_ATG14575 [Phytophthora infestans]
MGAETDTCGKRYGYLVLHSVDLPECPPFSQSFVARGEAFFTCIFRESTPGFVDILARGIFDMSGERKLLPMLSSNMMSVFIDGLRKLVDCADAKKLTLLARRTALRVDVGQTSTQLPPPPKGAICVVCIRRDGSGLFTGQLRSCRVCGMPICSKCQVKKKRVFLGSDRPWSYAPCRPMCALE